MKAVFPQLKNDLVYKEEVIPTVKEKDIEEQLKTNDEKIETLGAKIAAMETPGEEGIQDIRAKASKVTMETSKKIENIKKAIVNVEDVTRQDSIVLERLKEITKVAITKFNLNNDATIPISKEEPIKLTTNNKKTF